MKDDYDNCDMWWYGCLKNHQNLSNCQKINFSFIIFKDPLYYWSGHCYVDIDSIGQLFIYFQSMVPQNNPGGGNEFPPSPWEISGHPNKL